MANASRFVYPFLGLLIELTGDGMQIACYKNKVQEWRNGVETNLDDVLQISNVFVNVSKGEVAKTQDLQKAFGTVERDDVVKEVCTTMYPPSWAFSLLPSTRS